MNKMASKVIGSQILLNFWNSLNLINWDIILMFVSIVCFAAPHLSGFLLRIVHPGEISVPGLDKGYHLSRGLDCQSG